MVLAALGTAELGTVALVTAALGTVAIVSQAAAGNCDSQPPETNKQEKRRGTRCFLAKGLATGDTCINPSSPTGSRAHTITIAATYKSQTKTRRQPHMQSLCVQRTPVTTHTLSRARAHTHTHTI